MSNSEVLNTDILRGRIISSEYKDLTVEKVRQIYIEETGHEPPARIEIYHSEDVLDQSKKDSGFDGTAIHFFDEEKGINQVYTIARGSESSEKDQSEGSTQPLDWLYNAFGIFVGTNNDEYQDAKKFNETIQEKVQENIESFKKNRENSSEIPSLKEIGMGHSLGGNLVITLQLLSDGNGFDQVYTINDAPPSFYQLALLDEKFLQSLSIRFNLNFKANHDAIYNLPPEKLKAFAQKYYNDKGVTKNIHHLTALQDILYALSGARGFMDVGDRKLIDTDSKYGGLRKTFDKIPDQKIQQIQKFLAQYGDVYNRGGMNDVIKAATGIDMNLLEDIKKHSSDNFHDFSFKKMDDIVEDLRLSDLTNMITDMRKKLPGFIKEIDELTENLDGVLQPFVEEKLMTKSQKEEILTSLDGIKANLRNVYEMVRDLKWSDFLLGTPDEIALAVAGFIQTGIYIWGQVSEIMERFDTIKEDFEDVSKALSKSTTAHGISQLLNSLNVNADVAYKGNDLMVTVKQDDGERIKVNLSSAVRIYRDGAVLYQQLQNELSKLINVYHDEFVEYYTKHRNKVMTKIAEIEQNPKSYGDFLPFSMNVFNERTIKSINVHEKFQPFDSVMFEDYEFNFQAIQKDITKGLASINEIKKSIEELFKGDKRIAMLIGGQ